MLQFAALVMAITTLPYIIGFAAQGLDWRFTGFVFGVEDGNSYIAKMLSGADGAWLFRTPYTTSPQAGIVAFLPYLLLGKLAQPPGMHEQLVALFHLFRIGAGFLAILATYDFLAVFLDQVAWRRIGLVLGTLGGGLGWVLVISGRVEWFGSLPLEFYSPESFGFLALFGLPHLALVRALLLWGLVAYLRGSSKTGLLWLFLGMVQPLYVIVAWAVLAGHLALLGARQAWSRRWNQTPNWPTWRVYFIRGVWSVAISCPPVLYTLVASNQDPFFKAWTAQNLILSPHPVHYLLAYGLVGLGILAGLPAVWRQIRTGNNNSGSFLLPVAWSLILPLLVYAPYPLQRRLAEGAWIALIVLALAGLESRPIRGWQALILLLPSTFLLWTGGMISASHPDLPLFRPTPETAAFDFIAQEAEPGAVVLSSYETGNALPAWAPVRVIAGHGPESPGVEELKPRLEQFFSMSMSDLERRSFVNEFQIRYIFWGPFEQALGAWNPHTTSNLHQVYTAGGYEIFAVQENPDD